MCSDQSDLCRGRFGHLDAEKLVFSSWNLDLSAAYTSAVSCQFKAQRGDLSGTDSLLFDPRHLYCHSDFDLWRKFEPGIDYLWRLSVAVSTRCALVCFPGIAGACVYCNLTVLNWIPASSGSIDSSWTLLALVLLLSRVNGAGNCQQ